MRFRSGLDDRRAMLTRQHAVLDQEYALKTLEADQLLAMVDLMEALGGGYVNDLQIVQLKPEQKQSWLVAMVEFNGSLLADMVFESKIKITALPI